MLNLHHAYGVAPDNHAAQTGYMQGAAGMGTGFFTSTVVLRVASR
jgi:hypothetical protein